MRPGWLCRRSRRRWTPSRLLFRRYHIGFTDLVKRATPRAAELADADYRQGARVLQKKLVRYAPAIAWFHGVSAYRLFLAHHGNAARKGRRRPAA